MATAATAEAAATSEAAATGTEEVLRRGKKRRGSRGVSRQRKKKRALERAGEIARIRRLNEPPSSPFRRSSTRTGTKQSPCRVEEEFGCKHNSSAPLKQERRSRKRRREKKTHQQRRRRWRRRGERPERRQQREQRSSPVFRVFLVLIGKDE